ncbi:hypothetical protein FACS1894184_09170 [Clostridia bacterium]|nr:hypothetical protein FACS1894184_09170 [Clostridia bacterium]
MVLLMNRLWLNLIEKRVYFHWVPDTVCYDIADDSIIIRCKDDVDGNILTAHVAEFQRRDAIICMPNDAHIKGLADFVIATNWTGAVFHQKTQLSIGLHSQLVNDQIDALSFDAILAINIALGNSHDIVKYRYLQPSKYDFGRDRGLRAREYFLTDMHGYDVDSCKRFLSAVSVPTLGKMRKS